MQTLHSCFFSTFIGHADGHKFQLCVWRNRTTQTFHKNNFLHRKSPRILCTFSMEEQLVGGGQLYPEDCVLHVEASPFQPEDFLLHPNGKSQVYRYLLLYTTHGLTRVCLGFYMLSRVRLDHQRNEPHVNTSKGGQTE